MKKQVLLTSLLALVYSVQAQDVMVVEMNDNTVHKFKVKDIHQVIFEQPSEEHNYPVAEAIDLGLPSGTLWASWNVGASAPEEYGGYYAWGETEEKEVYDWSTYTHCDGSAETFHYIGDDIAGSEYDVAHVKWGGLWQMPSDEQFRELQINCTISWTNQNGVNGISVTGPNGNSIFFPAGGDRREDNHNFEGTRGVFWTSTFSPNHSAYYYILTNGDMYNEKGICSRGYTIRPVVSSKKPKDDCLVAEAIDLGLPSGTKWASWNVGASAPEEYGHYYAWGETESKEIYNRDSYAYYDNSANSFNHIGNNISETEYDVARVKWGGSWSMPTFDEFQELFTKCSKVWTTQNGVKGLLLTGPNGATIFFPAGGYRTGESQEKEKTNGYFWTSNLYASQDEGEIYALRFTIDSGGASYFHDYRPYGYSIRPVISPDEDPYVEPECPVAEAIDLGLPSGTKWASWNVGASAPEECGHYYAWGETVEKYKFTSGNYKYTDKYLGGYINIGSDIAGTEYDVAYAKWGGDWKMPTKNQINELLTNCTHVLTSKNGVSGALFTGPNGNSIFMPLAGYRQGEDYIRSSTYGYYWTSTLGPAYRNNAYYLYFGYGSWAYDYYIARHNGFTVRAVCP